MLSPGLAHIAPTTAYPALLGLVGAGAKHRFAHPDSEAESCLRPFDYDRKRLSRNRYLFVGEYRIANSTRSHFYAAGFTSRQLAASAPSAPWTALRESPAFVTNSRPRSIRDRGSCCTMGTSTSARSAREHRSAHRISSRASTTDTGRTRMTVREPQVHAAQL